MAHNIHARQTEEGLRFRIWSTNSGTYLTEEMTEEEIRLHTLKVAVCDTIAKHQTEISDRIQRTAEKGTSCWISNARNLSDPWDEEKN